MRFLIAILLSVQIAAAQFNDPAFVGSLARAAGGGGISYIVSEDCEGTGTPSGWTDTSVNWDETGTVLLGSQSLSVGSGSMTYYTISGVTYVEWYCLFRINSLPAATSSFASIRDSGGSALAIFRVNNTGQVTVFANGSDSTAAATTISAATTYHVWLVFNSGGTCSVGFSTTGTRPTSGNQFTSKTGASGTAARVTGGNSSGVVAYYDHFRAATTTIPSNP